MKIEICDICRNNPEKDVLRIPVKLVRFEYREKWWKLKKEKIVVCKYCIKKIFNREDV